MKTVIFDLDGTLADTSADLIAAANACFEAEGYGSLLDEREDQLTAFHGGRAMLRLGFSRVGVDDESRIDANYPKLLDFYRDNICVKTVLYPGVLKVIDDLEVAGFKIGVCTNKPEALADELLQQLNVRACFGSLIGADTLPVRKPDPKPYVAAVEGAGGALHQSVLIGDTITDVNTARAAGVPIVLVGFGPEGEAVSRLAPDAILPHYDDLVTVVEELIG